MNDRDRIHVAPLRFAVVLAAYLAHDYCSYFLSADLGYLFVVALCVGVIVAAIVDAGLALAIVAVLIVFSDDMARLDLADSGLRLNSLLTVSLGGIAIGNLLALAVCAIGVFAAVLRWGRRPDGNGLHAADFCVFAIVGVYLAATIHGYASLDSNPRGALNDWNHPMLLAAFYFYVRTQANTAAALTRLWSYLFLAIGAKALAWAFWFYAGTGVAFGLTTIRVATESGRVLLVFALVSGFILQDRRIGLALRERLVAFGISAFAALNLIADASRGPWLMSAFGILAIVMLGNFAGKVRWAALAAILLPAIGLGLWQTRPQAFDQIGYFWSTLQFWEEGNIERSTSTMVRVYEFRNIHAQLIDHDNVLLGEGPGSRFSDAYHEVPFELRENDYTLKEIESRSFENPHGLLPNLMLDTGYGGLVVYLGAMVLLYLSVFGAFWRTRDASLRAIAMSLIAFLPAIVYMSWSPKINMCVGIFVGMVGALRCLTSPGYSPRRASEMPSREFPFGSTSVA